MKKQKPGEAGSFQRTPAGTGQPFTSRQAPEGRGAPLPGPATGTAPDQGHAPQLRREGGRPVDFYLSAPGARSVRLAGDFTGWERSAVEMTRAGDGVWKASVAIGPGRHAYRMIVDGEWREDPCGHLREPNPFGSYNTVIEVR